MSLSWYFGFLPACLVFFGVCLFALAFSNMMILIILKYVSDCSNIWILWHSVFDLSFSADLGYCLYKLF